MNQHNFLMDNQCVLVSASRYLNVVYDIDLFSEDESAVWKLRSYARLLHEDQVLTEYWEMYKRNYHQKKALVTDALVVADDFSLWDDNLPTDDSSLWDEQLDGNLSSGDEFSFDEKLDATAIFDDIVDMTTANVTRNQDAASLLGDSLADDSSADGLEDVRIALPTGF